MTGPLCSRQAASWTGRCLLASLGLAAAITATWQPGAGPFAGTAERLQMRLPGGLLIVLAVAAVTAWLAIVSLLLRPPPSKDPDAIVLEPPAPPRLPPLTLLLLGLLLAVALGGCVFVARRLAFQHGAGPLPGLAFPRAKSPLAPPLHPLSATVHAAVFDWSFTLALGSAAAMAIAVAGLVIAANEPWAVLLQWARVRRRQRRLVRGLAATLATGLRDLAEGDDPRQAVILCYRRCEAVLAAQRRRRYPADPPREFMADALAALNLPAKASRSLLLVFERARYSNLPVATRDRETARQALDEIRSALQRTAEDGHAP